ncbi:histone H1 [Chloroflexota bacterium]
MVTRKKKEHDFAITAFRVVQEATGRVKGGFDARALGRLGGLKGGKARAESLTPERRAEIARKAALARWGSRA